MLKTRSLYFAYDKNNEFRFPNIDLEPGEDLLILGESGIGKTTLLHLISGLIYPISGSVELSGTVLSNLSPGKLDRFRGKHIGLVFQRSHFVSALTLQENLALVQFLAGNQSDTNRIRKVLKDLGIDHKRKDKPHHLSQGEQQRASIAMAIVNNPELILADEPTASLDDKNCARVANLLKEQASATDAQLIIITHDRRLKDLFKKSITL